MRVNREEPRFIIVPGFLTAARAAKLLELLAAVALKQIHWIYGYCVATDGVVAFELHNCLHKLLKLCEILMYFCRTPAVSYHYIT